MKQFRVKVDLSKVMTAREDTWYTRAFSRWDVSCEAPELTVIPYGYRNSIYYVVGTNLYIDKQYCKLIITQEGIMELLEDSGIKMSSEKGIFNGRISDISDFCQGVASLYGVDLDIADVLEVLTSPMSVGDYIKAKSLKGS